MATTLKGRDARNLATVRHLLGEAQARWHEFGCEVRDADFWVRVPGTDRWTCPVGLDYSNGRRRPDADCEPYDSPETTDASCPHRVTAHWRIGGCSRSAYVDYPSARAAFEAAKSLVAALNGAATDAEWNVILDRWYDAA
jgi:hypothetical protein